MRKVTRTIVMTEITTMAKFMNTTMMRWMNMGRTPKTRIIGPPPLYHVYDEFVHMTYCKRFITPWRHGPVPQRLRDPAAYWRTA